MPWEDPATAFRSASTYIPAEIAAKKAAAAVAEAQALADQAQVHSELHPAWQLALPIQQVPLYVKNQFNGQATAAHDAAAEYLPIQHLHCECLYCRMLHCSWSPCLAQISSRAAAEHLSVHHLHCERLVDAHNNAHKSMPIRFQLAC